MIEFKFDRTVLLSVATAVLLLIIVATAILRISAINTDASETTADHVPQELPADLT